MPRYDTKPQPESSLTRSSASVQRPVGGQPARALGGERAVGLRADHVDDAPAFVRAYRDAGAEVRDDESALLVAFAERRRGAARHRALVQRVDEAAALYLRRARDARDGGELVHRHGVYDIGGRVRFAAR